MSFQELPPEFTPVITADDIGFEGLFSQPVEGCGSRGAEQFFRAQMVEAKRLFVATMASEWKERLFKCRHPRCGIYFLNSKTPRRSYKHGTFCRVHLQNWAAALASDQKRTREASQLIEAAAKWLVKRRRGPDWQNLKRQKIQLATDISVSQILGRAVTVKWVTRNQANIERRRLEITGKSRDATMTMEHER